MKRWRSIVFPVFVVGVGCIPAQVMAQALPPTDAIAGSPSGVLSFPLSFFADSNPTTANDMVRRVPGFVLIDTEQDVRGLSGATGNVLIDGQAPSAKSISLMNLLQRIPAATVERIDLIRGGAPGIDMQGQPVVVNIIRRGGSYSTYAVTVFAKSYLDGGLGPLVRFEAARRSDDVSLEATLSMRDEKMQLDSGEGPFVLRSADGNIFESGEFNTDYWTRQIDGGVTAELVRGPGVLRLIATVSSDRNDRNESYETLNLITGPAVEYTEIDFESSGGEVGATYEHRFGDRWLSELVLLQTYEREAQVAGTFGRRPGEQADEIAIASETIAQATTTFEPSSSFKLEFGGEAALNSLDVESARFSGGVPIVLPVANVLVEENRAEVFATASWSPVEGVDLEFSSRFETSTISLTGDAQQEKSLSFFKPRLLAAWEVTPGTQLRLRMEREVGQLDFEDFAASSDFSEGVVSAGNPDLEPEVADVIELAAEQRFWERGAVVLTYRHDELQQVVDLIPIDGRFDAPGNIGDGTRDELRLSLTIPLERLGISGGLLRLNGTRRWSSVIDPVTGEGRRISGERAFEGDVHISRDVPSLKSSFAIEGELPYSQSFFRLRQIQTIDQGGSWKAFWDYTPRPDLVFRFQIENFTSRERTRTRTLFTGPRDGAAVNFIERRSAIFDPFFLVRLRKTF